MTRPFTPQSLSSALCFLVSIAVASAAGADDSEAAVEARPASDEEPEAAQGEEEASPSPDDTEGSGSEAGEGQLVPSESSAEDPTRTKLLIGARYRALITPKFLMNSFGVDGGRTVLVHGIGPELGAYFPKDGGGLTLLFSPWFAGYGLEQTPFKAKGDSDAEWEIIESDLNVWYLTMDALWDSNLSEKIGFFAGLGVGIGIIGGELRRHQAYVTGSGDGDVPDLELCVGPGQPNFAECPLGENYDIPDGSSDAWSVYPWITFQTGVRYQPVDEFVARLDIGVGSAGFWFGLGADHSLEL